MICDEPLRGGDAAGASLHDEPSGKRRRAEGGAAGQTVAEELITVNLATLAGTRLGVASAPALAPGRALVASARKVLGEPASLLRLVQASGGAEGCAEIDEEAAIEGLAGSTLQVIFSEVLEEQVEEVMYRVESNKELGDLWQVWAGLRDAAFDQHFSRPLGAVGLPPLLERLHLGYDFNCALEREPFPRALQHLGFSHHFDQPLEHVRFPPALRHLHLGVCFNRPLSNVELPCLLESLHLGYWFDRPLQDVVFPPTLRTLSLSRMYSHTLRGVRLPPSLRKLVAYSRKQLGVDLPSEVQIEVIELQRVFWY